MKTFKCKVNYIFGTFEWLQSLLLNIPIWYKEAQINLVFNSQSEKQFSQYSITKKKRKSTWKITHSKKKKNN